MRRYLKLKQPINKLIPHKCPVFWKTQPNLFQNCGNLNTRQETIFKANCGQRIVSLYKNSKKTFSRGKQSQRNTFIVQKFESTERDKQANSLQKNCFQMYLQLKNCFFVKKTPRSFLLKVNKTKRMTVLSRNLKIQYPKEKPIPYKSPVLSKRQPNLFQNCRNLNTTQETIFKANCVYRIVCLYKNSKKASSLLTSLFNEYMKL